MLHQVVSERYLSAVYWAFTTMTTVGCSAHRRTYHLPLPRAWHAISNGRRRYGDIVPMNDAEIGAAIFAMIVGVSVFAFIVGAHGVLRQAHAQACAQTRAQTRR
jgi:hypothetical protein